MLAVDLGTSTTKAVVRRPDGEVVTLEFDGDPLLPSAVCAVSGGRLVAGSGTLSPKRFIGREPVTLGHRDYAADELVAAVLRRVLDEVDGVPDRVVLTFPAGWGPARRMVLVEAARRLGVTEPMLLPEPVAAARYVNSLHPCAVPVGRTTVVYDLGAGTFDATVLRRTPHGFTQLATEELPDAGGEAIDAALAASLSNRASSDRASSDRVRVAKERLSHEASTTVQVLDRTVQLTRQQLEAVARPILDRTVAATRAALVAAGPPATRLAAVFLIGGASRIPLAALLLHNAFGVAPVLVDRPDLVVARGAAMPGSRPIPAPVEYTDPAHRPWISRLTRAVTLRKRP